MGKMGVFEEYLLGYVFYIYCLMSVDGTVSFEF